MTTWELIFRTKDFANPI